MVKIKVNIPREAIRYERIFYVNRINRDVYDKNWNYIGKTILFINPPLINGSSLFEINDTYIYNYYLHSKALNGLSYVLNYSIESISNTVLATSQDLQEVYDISFKAKVINYYSIDKYDIYDLEDYIEYDYDTGYILVTPPPYLSPILLASGIKLYTDTIYSSTELKVGVSLGSPKYAYWQIYTLMFIARTVSIILLIAISLIIYRKFFRRK
jgi:hypothetical protein